jgi:hypothetical protein
MVAARRDTRSSLAARITRTDAIVALGCIVTGASQGLAFGTHASNQAFYVLPGLRRIDPTLLQGDWWTTQTTHYHHAFSFLVAFLELLGVLEWGLAVGNVLAGALVAYLAYRVLDRILDRQAVVAWLVFVVLFFAMTGTRDVMRSYVLSDSLQPSTIAGVAYLGALVAFLLGRFGVSGILLATSGVFHTNYLILGLVSLGTAQLLIREPRFLLRSVKQLGPAALLLAVEVPRIVNLMASNVPNANLAREIFVKVAVPFHYMPLWYLFEFVPTLGWHLVSLALMGLATRRVPWGRRFGAIYCTLVSMIWVATVLTTAVYVESVARLFVWRLAPFAALLGFLIISVAVVRVWDSKDSWASTDWAVWRWGLVGVGLLLVLRYQWYHRNLPAMVVVVLLGIALLGIWCLRRFRNLEPSVNRARISSAVVVLLVATAVALTYAGGRKERFNLVCDSCRDASKVELYSWIRTTEPESLFVVPPEQQDFRLLARRAIVVDWKGLPVKPDEILEWYIRLGDVCGMDNLGSREFMTRGYNSMTPERLAVITRKYGVDYVVVARGGAGERLPGETVFLNDRYRVLVPPGRPGHAPSRRR